MQPADLSVIRDQRVMVGKTMHSSVEEVEAAWQEWVDDPRHVLATRLRDGDTDKDLRESRKTVQAYISGGKWIADCPNCNGGIAAWRENPRGACLDCGTIYRVEFPSVEEEDAAVNVLSRRPDTLTRSWHRHLGETVADLEAENERYLDPPRPTTQLVDLADVVRVLGDRAAEQLQREGIV